MLLLLTISLLIVTTSITEPTVENVNCVLKKDKIIFISKKDQILSFFKIKYCAFVLCFPVRMIFNRVYNSFMYARFQDSLCQAADGNILVIWMIHIYRFRQNVRYCGS